MGAEASRHVTMDELEDEERMKREDAEERRGGGRGSSGEESGEDGDGMDEEMEKVLQVEERQLIAEAGDDVEEDDDDDYEDDSSDDEDDEDLPSGSFQARLERLRARSRGRPILDMLEEELDAEYDDFDPSFKWETGGDADEDDLVAQVQEFLDENEDILKARDKKQRNKIFRAVQNGDFDMGDAEMWGLKPAKRNKDKDVPPELQAQWAKDRAKKAEAKLARDQARLEAAADPLAKKKGGKKGRKAMLLAASLDPTITTLPNRVTDLASVEAQIRRFLADIGGSGSMVLPPMAKDSRKAVHELAAAFNLKSESKGKGDGRYTTLKKTTRSGFKANEKKVRGIMRSNGVYVNVTRGGGGGGGGGKGGTMKPKEGEEVGKAAPRIDRGNIGFRMLAAMGWAEGDRVGASGGLDVPLTAIVKTTKLGLGAEFDDRRGKK
ncbi:uncharacterized protein STEHIDRAFT_101963 [Stereum hirsutum FP-91666 SS1]|uniref:uncharacterized protein n=1 Tax=Stereum hirsutum (strain FP-91666) TaxID=721885 RepID=UPI0004449800|nr:uncharacterized protein STEHIDRAFT_101963 [Stereum hirsutum FP-91666 SS1]EIM82616.1 hypothetical protein STEHIDRAFT_101963 [Stereum hirsutum FP-91666 SS1]